MAGSTPDNITQSVDLKEIERLRSKHLLYEEYKPKWDFYLRAYEGGEAFANKENLFKHPREHQDDYNERLQRIHYLNYCEPLVDFFTDFIFGETIQRNGGSNEAFFDNFVDDVNLKGEDISEFMREVAEDFQIFGMCYVLVDAPLRDPNERLTKAQEQKLGLRPYWVIVRPDEVYDWIIDQFDRFQYVKRYEHRTSYIPAGVPEMNADAAVAANSAGDEIISLSTKQEIERYTEWTPNAVIISEIDVTEPTKPRLLPKQILPNKLGVVPMEVFRFKRSKIHKFMGNSFLTDLSYNNREVMNLTSLLQEFLYRQCFNILAVETDQSLNAAEQQEGELGTANMLTYPKGANPPTYVAPSSDPADKLMEERQRLVNEMYKRAAQDTVNELFNGGKSSGFSKAQSFSTTVPKIANRAEILQDGENRLMDLTMRYMGKSWDGKIKYKDRYEITNITDAITQITSIFRDLQLPSPTFAKQELKRLVHELDGQIQPSDMVTIEAEIDKIDFNGWMETQKEALIGLNKNSVADQQKNKQAGMTTAAQQATATKQPVTGATKKPKGS